MEKFWNWINNEATGERTLHFDGVIAAESWWGDEITPSMFRNELFAGDGDITIWINSPGGDCIAASQIYTMLGEYKGNITVKIDGLAASAASVVAMAGKQVLMSPTALIMVHNPWSVAIGDSEEMRRAQDMLDEVKESIINAYQRRTGQSRADISNWMDAETWMNANKAIELGFADGMLESENQTSRPVDEKLRVAATNFMFSRRAVTNSLLDKMNIQRTKPTNSKPVNTAPDVAKEPTMPQATSEPPAIPEQPNTPQGVCAELLSKRLFLIPHQNLTQRR